MMRIIPSLCTALLVLVSGAEVPTFARELSACISAEDARSAYYGTTYDDDLLACLAEVPTAELPEKAILRILTYVDLGQYSDARALIDGDEPLDPLLTKPIQDALRFYVAAMEEQGINIFARKMRILDQTGNEMFGSTIGSDNDLAALALLNTPSRFEEFERRIDRYTITHPGEQWPYVAKAQLAVRANKPALAVSVLSFALSLGYTRPDLYYWMARALEMQGRFDAALTAYDQHIAATAMPCQGYLSSSVVRGFLNQDERSIADSTRAIETCRDVHAKVQAHHNRAGTNFRHGKLEAAIADYNFAIANGTDRQRLVAKNDLAGRMLNAGHDNGTCVRFEDLIRDGTEVYRISVSDIYDNALKNFSICLSQAPTATSGAVKTFLDASLFRVAMASRAQKVDLAITALLAFIGLQAVQPRLLYPNATSYYALLQKQSEDAERSGYGEILSVFSILGGDAHAISRALQQLQGAEFSIQALALFAVDRSRESRQDFANVAEHKPILDALRASVMANDSGRSVYLNLTRRYP